MLDRVEGWGIAVDLTTYCSVKHSEKEYPPRWEASFIGGSRREVKRAAKAAGWLLFRNGLAVCPKHHAHAARVRAR